MYVEPYMGIKWKFHQKGKIYTLKHIKAKYVVLYVCVWDAKLWLAQIFIRTNAVEQSPVNYNELKTKLR